MKRYIGTKIVYAAPMSLGEYNKYRGWHIPKDEDPSRGGYLVEYIGAGDSNHSDHENYISWCPKETFESANRMAEGMSFGMSLEAMKLGAFVARKGWYGKGMFIYLVHGTTVPLDNLRGNCAKAVEASSNTAPVQDICGHIDMKAADGSIVVGWLASQTDMLTDDWEIIL